MTTDELLTLVAQVEQLGTHAQSLLRPQIGIAQASGMMLALLTHLPRHLLERIAALETEVASLKQGTINIPKESKTPMIDSSPRA